MAQFSCCNIPEHKMLFRWHEFANKTKHIVCHCPQCGKYFGYAPKHSPYTELVTGNYIPPKKPTKLANTTPKIDKSAITTDSATAILAAIVNIPDIDKYIGTILYNKARNVIK